MSAWASPWLWLSILAGAVALNTVPHGDFSIQNWQSWAASALVRLVYDCGRLSRG